MSEAPPVESNQPLHPFNVYTLEPDFTTKKEWVGGTYDNISSVTVACAAFTAWQNYSPGGGVLVGVFDDTDALIAFIGRVIT